MIVRAVLEPAYVLHRRRWRDTSLIIDTFSLNHGRGALVARGARRPKARLAGLLQPFTALELSWYQRGDLGTLTGAEGHGGIRLAGRALISGFYVNELLVRLLARHDPHPAIYAAYERVLGGLAGAGGVARVEQQALRRFERVLLDETGYGLTLSHDVHGQPIDPEADYDYHPRRGAQRAGHTVREGDEVKSARIRGRTLLALDRGELDDSAVLREGRDLMRVAIAACLGGRPLQSRALFRRSLRARPETGFRDTRDDEGG